MKEAKCYLCGERGGILIRKDGYADYKVMSNGKVKENGFTEMDDDCMVECLECGEELDYDELEESLGKDLRWY